MTDEPQAVVLNANQRRHFEVLFARLEDSLSTVEALLAGKPARRHVLSLIEDDVTDGFREHAGPILAGLREQVTRVASELELRPRKLSQSRAIAATLRADAIRIEDSLSSQLQGYGEVHPSVARHLDPVLQDMAQTLDALSTAIRHTTRSSPHP